MKKEVYIPSIDELKEIKNILQTNDFMFYRYCLAKKIEIIIANGGLEFCGADEKNDYNIVSKIIRYYPENIWCTPWTSDIALAEQVISKEPINCEHSLDNLSGFSINLLNNNEFFKKLIINLSDILKKDPKYRFEYKKSDILDNIFTRKISSDHINIYAKNLFSIEPSYVLDGKIENCEKYILAESICNYACRFGVNNESDKENIECKKLIRFLQEHKN